LVLMHVQNEKQSQRSPTSTEAESPVGFDARTKL